MSNELFDKLQQLSNLITDNFNVIDEPIDIKLQMEYFKRSKKVRFKSDEVELNDICDLSNTDLDDEQLRDRMIQLASIDDPKAYRILEEYAKDKSNKLHAWALMALQESKMLIEGNLLNERQVFVSTGLGGKGKLLRYFVALIGNNIDEFAPYQQHIIQSEFETALKNNRSDIEDIQFQGKYAALTVLIPLDVPCHQTLLSAVEECNLYGNFIKSDFLITNVKMLSFSEIDDFVAGKMDDISSDNDEVDIDELNDPSEDDSDGQSSIE
ncbi:MAG: hypothetical protein J6T98_11500 [Salinivirgaceae bacterium]|nr:hypothetical protein [Salinivirgaceae bacterium]